MQQNSRIVKDRFWTLILRETNDAPRHLLSERLFFGRSSAIEELFDKLWREYN